MDLVVDTNIFLAVALHEPERGRIITVTADATVLAPEVFPYEVGNALSAMVKRKRLTEADALEAEKLVRKIPVRLVPTDVRGSLQLAMKHDIFAYDAYFLQCALAISCPLLTLDRRMKQVAIRLGIRVLE